MEQGRVELNESDPDYAETSYIVSVNEWGETPTTVSEFLMYTRRLSTYVDVVYPTDATLTDEQRAWIAQDVSDWEKALYSYDYDTDGYAYWTTLDVDSFVDMYVLNEFVINDDFSAFSTYLYKDVRGLVTLGPPWDYDNCFDNYEEPTPPDQFYIVERGAWLGAYIVNLRQYSHESAVKRFNH